MRLAIFFLIFLHQINEKEKKIKSKRRRRRRRRRRRKSKRKKKCINHVLLEKQMIYRLAHDKVQVLSGMIL
jgi:hypothetical protein